MKLAGALDANVAIGLSRGGVFDLLLDLYSPLYVPQAVVQEVVGQGQSRPGAAELTRHLGAGITEVAPSPQSLQGFPAAFPQADREVLATAREYPVDHILTGDEGLRREAQRHGFTCLRASEIVVLLKQQGLIPAVRPVLDLMRQQGFGLDDTLYQQALRAAGE